MPSFANLLARIPGVAGYEGARAANEQGELLDIQKSAGLVGLVKALEERREQERLRQSLAGATNPEEAIKRLLASGSTAAIAIAAKLKALQPQKKPVGSGGLYDEATGQVIPPAARPEAFKAPPMRTRVVGDMQVQEELQTDGTWKKVGEGPRFAKQVGPTVVQPPAATVTDIVDPTNTAQMLKVDARVYRGGGVGSRGVLGVSGKVGEAQKDVIKRQFQSQGVGAAIQQAEDLLTGKGGEELPTASGIGSAIDTAAALVGYTPPGAKTADRLRVVGGFLVQRVPRFEGPQSDKDVAHYKDVAGRIGDSNLPTARRLAALKEVENIWGQFEGGKKSGFFTPIAGQHAGGAIAPAKPDIERLLEKYK